MVKLLRIDSVREDGRMLPNFTEDILLNENASIALKDLCFQPEFEVISINNRNNLVTTIPDSQNGASNILEQRVQPQVYTFKENFKLAQETTNSLNRTLGLGQTDPQYTQFSSYKIRSETEHPDADFPLDIHLRLSPVCPLNIRGSAILASDDVEYFGQSDAFGTAPVKETTVGVRRLVSQAVANVPDERFRVVANKGVCLNKGCAIFYAQIFDSQTLGGGLVESNGFKIGVTLERLKDSTEDTDTTNPRVDPGNQSEDIPATARNFEIDFRETGLPYRFRSGGLKSSPAQQNSTVNPHRIAEATVSTNDIVAIRVNTFSNQKVIEGVVLQLTGGGGTGQEHLLFRHILTDDDIGSEFGDEVDSDDKHKIFFTPYLVMRGAEGACRLCNVRFTPDVCMDTSTIIFNAGGDFNVGDSNLAVFPNTHDHVLQRVAVVDNAFQNVIPQVELETFPQLQALNTHKSTISFSNELGLGLGLGARNKDPLDEIFRFSKQNLRRYDDDVIEGGDPRKLGIFGWKFDIQNPMPSFGDDYFIVELNNLNLDSYSSIPNFELGKLETNRKANQGERKNIVATIPVGNTAFDSKITYEPNELNFIGIKNSSTANLRNLQVRILHPDYTPIQTYGRTHICLYVKD